ncbi:MAG: hypothetical protein ACN6RK_01065 [Stenotrophomonas sp.]
MESTFFDDLATTIQAEQDIPFPSNPDWPVAQVHFWLHAVQKPMQIFKPWLPVERVPAFLSGVFILQHVAGAMTLVCDGHFEEGKLLVLRFEGFKAVCTHEEFSHQWPGESGSPVLPKSPGGSWTFPFLKIENSFWAKSSVKAITFDQVPQHYCIISGSDIVDVLSVEPPEVTWTTPAELELVMAAIGSLGVA